MSLPPDSSSGERTRRAARARQDEQYLADLIEAAPKNGTFDRFLLLAELSIEWLSQEAEEPRFAHSRVLPNLATETNVADVVGKGSKGGRRAGHDRPDADGF